MKVYVVVDSCYDTYKGVFRKEEYAKEFIEEMKSEGKGTQFSIMTEEV